MDNSVTLVGNITRDPELRFVGNGQAHATFGLAVSRRWQNRNTQEWEEQTSFFDVVCWRELADNVADSLGKGARVIVNGRLEQRSWQTENGEKRYKIEVIADEVGPSLRWATAKVERNERKSPDGSGGRSSGRGSASSGSYGSGGGSGSGGYGSGADAGDSFGASGGSASDYEDEEPF